MNTQTKPFIYVNISKLTDEVFYVGKGTHDNRPATRKVGNKEWANIADTEGFYSVVVAYFDTEQDALKAEAELVDELRNDGVYLTNGLKHYDGRKATSRTLVAVSIVNPDFREEYNGKSELEAAGFHKAHAYKAASGNRLMHGNRVWFYKDEEPTEEEILFKIFQVRINSHACRFLGIPVIQLKAFSE
jgi:hypothetical protein